MGVLNLSNDSLIGGSAAFHNKIKERNLFIPDNDAWVLFRDSIQQIMEPDSIESVRMLVDHNDQNRNLQASEALKIMLYEQILMHGKIDITGDLGVANPSLGNIGIAYNIPFPLVPPRPSLQSGSRTLGNKRYEATNHLGNVQSVFSDRKLIQQEHTYNNESVTHYLPDVRTYTDYYPYGMPMPERNDGQQEPCERIQLNDLKILTNADRPWRDFRTKNSATRRLEGSSIWLISYNVEYENGTPGGISSIPFDLLADRLYTLELVLSSTCDFKLDIYFTPNGASNNTLIYSVFPVPAGGINFSYTPTEDGKLFYEIFLTDANSLNACHLGIVKNRLSTQTTKWITDCGNGGATQNTEGYRYGFGGHEKVDEVIGTGKTVDMGDRWLDVRLGRTPKMDAKANKYPSLSPYSYAANSPLIFIDPDGKDIIPVHGTWSDNTTWEDLGGIKKATYNLFNDNNLRKSYEWSGGNYAQSRTEAALGLINYIRTQMNSESFNGQITLVGHSHGGNVSIEALNMMAEMKEFDNVQLNLLTINTPVRPDYQLSKKALARVSHVNVYDPKDPVQSNGGNSTVVLPDLPRTPNFMDANTFGTGEYGPAGRTFKNAKNIEVDNPQGFIEGHMMGLYIGDFHNSHNRVDDWIDKTEKK